MADRIDIVVMRAKGGYKLHFKANFSSTKWPGEHIAKEKGEVKKLVTDCLDEWLEGKGIWKEGEKR